MGKIARTIYEYGIGCFQIMPNHMHGIIRLADTVWASLAVAHNNAVAQNDMVAGNDMVADETRAGASPAPTKPKTVGDIVGAYKSMVANDCLEIFTKKYPDEMMGKLWQRNYHEHIIRNERSYHRISEYIISNPKNWNDDKFYNK